MNLEEEIKEIMADVFGVLKQDINQNTSMKTLEKWDSLRHLNLVVSIEEKFDIRLEPEEITQMLDFKRVIDFVEKK